MALDNGDGTDFDLLDSFARPRTPTDLIGNLEDQLALIDRIEHAITQEGYKGAEHKASYAYVSAIGTSVFYRKEDARYASYESTIEHGGTALELCMAVRKRIEETMEHLWLAEELPDVAQELENVVDAATMLSMAVDREMRERGMPTYVPLNERNAA